MNNLRFAHNKKRNTAFLFEVLIRELTKATLKKEETQKKVILDILKESFSPKSQLLKEHKLFKALYSTCGMKRDLAERLLTEAKKEYARDIDEKKLFVEQSRLLKKVHDVLGHEAFNNFVPNYKALATIAQVFHGKLPVKDRVLLEEMVLERLTEEPEMKKKTTLEPIDNLAFRIFLNKFNKTYGVLTENQKKLIQNYVLSFTDNGVGLKVFLNEEIGRLKEVVRKSLEEKEIKSDPVMLENAKKVLTLLETSREQKIGKEFVEKILKVQELEKEVKSND